MSDLDALGQLTRMNEVLELAEQRHDQMTEVLAKIKQSLEILERTTLTLADAVDDKWGQRGVKGDVVSLMRGLALSVRGLSDSISLGE